MLTMLVSLVCVTIIIIIIIIIIKVDGFYQHGEDSREFLGIGKGKGDPPDDDEGEEEEEEESDPVIIDMAYAAVQKLVTFVSSSEHKKVALEVFTTAT